MNVCIPVLEDRGLASPVCAHFGSAPMFLVADTGSGACRVVVNRNVHHEHGGCAPLASLECEALDCMVVGGIGRGALRKLTAAGIRVFLAGHATVGETLGAFGRGELRPLTEEGACGCHAQGEHRGQPSEMGITRTRPCAAPLPPEDGLAERGTMAVASPPVPGGRPPLVVCMWDP